MTTDDDGFLPARNETGNAGDDDGFSEDGTSEVVSNCAVGGEPHCFSLIPALPLKIVE